MRRQETVSRSADTPNAAITAAVIGRYGLETRSPMTSTATPSRAYGADSKRALKYCDESSPAIRV